MSEEAWAADWLYLATGNFSYINDIIATNASGAYTGYLSNIITSPGSTWQNTWVMSWDSRWGGVFSVLDPIVQGNANVPASTQADIHYFDKWQVQYWSHVPHDNTNDTNFIATTPAGFSYLTSWGSARYNTAAQLEALAYRKNFPYRPAERAVQQLGHGPDELPDGRQPGELVLHRGLRLERARRGIRGRRQRDRGHPSAPWRRAGLADQQPERPGRPTSTSCGARWSAGPARRISRTT